MRVVAKVIIDVTGAELPDLLRLPEVARLVDAGRVSIQRDDPPASDDLSTRQRGRESFERRATQRGLQVRTFSQPGVSDFIVEGPAISRPVRLICSESPRVSLRKEWAEPTGLICAYVWLLPTRTRIFLMSYKEAAGVLGEKALESSSFKDNGYYTTACTPRRQQAMERFEDRWEIFSP
jgi:hypothetical protein